MKKIKGFNYYVDKKGIIYNKNMLKLATYSNGKGYQKVKLYKKGETVQLYVHRIVAKAFLYTYSNSLQVNHKDLNKSNNSVKNLEWMTRKQNVKHYFKNRIVKC